MTDTAPAPSPHPVDVAIREQTGFGEPRPLSDIETRAARMRGRYSRELATIAADRDRTVEARTEALTDHAQRGNTALGELRDKYLAAEEKADADTARHLFGPGTGADKGDARRAWRQLLADYRSLDQDGALRALRTAELADDETAARALAATAWVSGWHKVLATYAESRPKVQELLERLLGDRRARRLEASILFGPLLVPTVPRPTQADLERASTIGSDLFPPPMTFRPGNL